MHGASYPDDTTNAAKATDAAAVFKHFPGGVLPQIVLASDSENVGTAQLTLSTATEDAACHMSTPISASMTSLTRTLHNKILLCYHLPGSPRFFLIRFRLNTQAFAVKIPNVDYDRCRSPLDYSLPVSIQNGTTTFWKTPMALEKPEEAMTCE
ncbi:hypothetical protein BG74_04230 [Sodalis-like endosymbiont of Proechinophthirus fluctus]|uniref:hypothetical protein n=1 Tax=Sodalis-like endosymbiont of Proechinophthirus fluctus TaxID=1462730 RepID=UPI0007A8C589|nr:hypothetical protein [Sodalis-like endosymbiont of Proechinophthirus fluctus]KYP97290.1 hypothetical protein BG74_04230 [Sodalis-like endosymbiont of Proechinophthirus fluctus]